MFLRLYLLVVWGCCSRAGVHLASRLMTDQWSTVGPTSPVLGKLFLSRLGEEARCLPPSSWVRPVSDVHSLRRWVGESGRLSVISVVWSLVMMLSACTLHPIRSLPVNARRFCEVLALPFSSLLWYFGSFCPMLSLVSADSKRELVKPQIMYPRGLIYAQDKNIVIYKQCLQARPNISTEKGVGHVIPPLAVEWLAIVSC